MGVGMAGGGGLDTGVEANKDADEVRLKDVLEAGKVCILGRMRVSASCTLCHWGGRWLRLACSL